MTDKKKDQNEALRIEANGEKQIKEFLDLNFLSVEQNIQGSDGHWFNVGELFNQFYEDIILQQVGHIISKKIKEIDDRIVELNKEWVDLKDNARTVSDSFRKITIETLIVELESIKELLQG